MLGVAKFVLTPTQASAFVAAGWLQPPSTPLCSPPLLPIKFPALVQASSASRKALAVAARAAMISGSTCPSTLLRSIARSAPDKFVRPAGPLARIALCYRRPWRRYVYAVKVDQPKVQTPSGIAGLWSQRDVPERERREARKLSG